MTTRPVLLTAAALMLALSGCSAAQNVASDAADAASARARSEAESALSSAIDKQVCAAIGDKQLSDADIKTLSTLLDQADAAGLQSDVLTPVRDVVRNGRAKAADIRAIQESCAA